MRLSPFYIRQRLYFPFNQLKANISLNMDKRQQPLWNPPDTSTSKMPELYLYNSLTSNKERFVPQEIGKVTWYSCGPTVYDSSHMGHARTYIAFDILRRTMQNYFNFNIHYVMNITDIDDKIIKRARQRYLFEKFKQEKHSYEDVKDYISKAVEIVEAKSKTDPESEKRAYLAQEAKRLRNLLSSSSPESTTPHSLIEASGDALSDLIDKERGSTVSDFKIFESLPRFYENEFHEDMKALNILPPNHLVRVSEYIDPIIKFTQQIIDNGFAYSTPSGSVYFDTNKFAQDPKHFYAKLMPTAFGDANQLATGEGELSIVGEKKSQSDFALWKASKPGEPAWESPWGKGRPGWHIECSAMASGCLGDSMDIHSGGVDLKFPHHDNELAQSEACLGHSHWVRYFLHSGHLTIDGCKMSKSLKNFITIRQALQQHSARQIRLAFLLHGWKDTLDYGANTMSEALALDRAFYDFTFNVSHLVFLALSQKPTETPLACSDQDNSAAYTQAYEKCKIAVYSSLCDSIDTRGAVNALRDLIAACNSLQVDQPLHSQHPHLRLITLQILRSCAFILRILRTFGAADETVCSKPKASLPDTSVIFDASIEVKNKVELPDCMPWVSLDGCTNDRMRMTIEGLSKATQNFMQDLAQVTDEKITSFAAGYKNNLALIEKVIAKVDDAEQLERKVWPLVAEELRCLACLRQTVRSYAQNEAVGETKKLSLMACDKLRDQYLPPYGIRLQDRVQGSDSSQADAPAIGLINPKFYLEEEQDKKRRADEKAAKQAAKEEEGKLPPEQMFLLEVDQYSKWDDRGIPTHDMNGEELPKSRIKKLLKMYDAQAKKHQAYKKMKQST